MKIKQEIIRNRELSIWEALIPVAILVGLLTYNVSVFRDDALLGSNQFILLVSTASAVIIGFINKIPFNKMLKKISENIESTSITIVILLFFGALSGTWLISGIIPAMIYYGLKILNPSIFLPACLIICALVSSFTGSSWATSATVGVALIGIGKSLNVPLGMTAGAIISGSYFGDKMSPISETTNLAPAMVGTDLYTHIQYMVYTTAPTIILSLILFVVLGLNLETSGAIDTRDILNSINSTFTVTPWLFIVPLIVLILIVKKAHAVIALFLGSLIAAVFAIIFQPQILAQLSDQLSESSTSNLYNTYKVILNAITVETKINTSNSILNELFSSYGMSGMLNTIWLIICAMVFGGTMDAIGALEKISKSLLNLFSSIFGLFTSTVISCITLNATASDQYLAIVIPGKMFSKAYKDKGLAPENLSRTLEDAGTVTSVLVPYNTGGAYHSKVLGVDTFTYLPYCFFNYLSPFVSLLFAALKIKIRMLSDRSGM